MATTTAAAILAGGQARRFGGRDKSHLLVAGRPIIVRQVEVLQQVADPVMIVGGPAARFADLPLVVYPDLIEGAGAIGGVYTALEAAPAAFVLVVACDLPNLDAGVLGELVRLAGRADADAAWIRTDRGAEPLIACYRRSCRDVIRRTIEAGHLALNDLARHLRVAELSGPALARFGPPEWLLANINTPGDYARIQ